VKVGYIRYIYYQVRKANEGQLYKDKKNNYFTQVKKMGSEGVFYKGENSTHKVLKRFYHC
jgi:hypothetical protein